jgi:hypothetical protein
MFTDNPLIPGLAHAPVPVQSKFLGSSKDVAYLATDVDRKYES